MPKKSGPLINHLDDDKRARVLADPPPKAEPEKPKAEPEKPKAEKALPSVEELKQSTREWAVREQLAAPFHPDELGERPDGTRYVLPVAVTERLDAVLGPVGWSFHLLEGGTLGSLMVTAGDHFGTRCARGADPGSALAACAELFGVGRYLKKVPPGPLPEWALPRIPDRDRKPWYRPPAEAASRPEPTTPVPSKPMPKGPVTEADWVNEWLGKFAAAETPEDFTAMLPGLKQVPQEFKKAVWDRICDEAREYHWRYDAATKKFHLESDGEPPLEF